MSASDLLPAPGYVECRPHSALAPYLACTWTSLIGEDLSLAARRIVPDGCIDLIWRDDAGLLVEGPATRPLIAALRPASLLVGVRFRPGLAPSLLGVVAGELRDRSLPLAEVWGAAGRDLACRLEDLPPRSRAGALESALLRRLDSAVDADPVVSNAVARLTTDPAIGVRELGADLGLSPRQLLRRFSERVGYGPRIFGRVMRFQRFLRRVENAHFPDRSLAAVAFAAGYADQAHLTRECRDLGGLPPARLLIERQTVARDVRFVQDGR